MYIQHAAAAIHHNLLCDGRQSRKRIRRKLTVMLYVECRHINKFGIQNRRRINAVAKVIGQRNAISKTRKYGIDACFVVRQIKKTLSRSRQTQAKKN